MIKKFYIQIPLSLKDSFDLLSKSGNDIKSWQTIRSDLSDFENGYIMWKQFFWSLTGTAAITAILTQTTEKETSVVIEIRKPLQILDPARISGMVFRKLDRAWKKNLISFENHYR